MLKWWPAAWIDTGQIQEFEKGGGRGGLDGLCNGITVHGNNIEVP